MVEAGRAILAEQGIEGFTLAAVCERAGVSIGSVYSRVDSIDGLFLAIHEHVMEELDARTVEIGALASRDDLSTDELIETVVDGVCRQFADHDGELRAFILRAAVDVHVRDLGVAHAARLASAFVEALRPRATDFPHDDPESAIRAAFQIVFDTLSWDTAFGRAFAANAPPSGALRERLSRLCILMLRSR